MQDSEIDLVGAMGICGMNRGLYLSRVVEQQVKHIMALVFIRANDSGIDRHMVSKQSVGNNALYQPKILGRMTGIGMICDR